MACRRGEDPSKVVNRVLEVPHTDSAIRDILLGNGIVPFATMEENKALLKDFVNSLVEPKMIVYRRCC